MRFETARPRDAEGAILAHGVSRGAVSFKKGRLLTAEDAAALAAADVETIVVARFDDADMPEDEAAARLARALAGDGATVAAAFTGRANLYAAHGGVFVVDAPTIDAINAVDEAITVATLPAFDLVGPRAMLATVKIIPFAAPRASVAECERLARAAAPVARVAPWRVERVGLISTSLPQTKPSLHAKNRKTLEDRLAPSGARVAIERVVAHETRAVADAIRDCLAAACELVLVYGASAIVDRRDVIPAGVEAAGGRVRRFGMPVDPGNLLLLAEAGGVPVIGLPGCARSPKLNGFDWVLQRLLARLPVAASDIARMGVGGLLKEIPSRPQPREGREVEQGPRAPHVAAVVLAAGLGSRMGGAKMIADVGGEPMIRHVVRAAKGAQVAETVVVLGHDADAVRAALDGEDVVLVPNPDYAAGLSASLKAGIAAVGGRADAAVVCLGDMPGVTSAQIDRLLAAFAPAEGRGIVVPTHRGKRGNPVLWGAGYFPEIARLSGDAGAKSLLASHADDVCEVEAGDDGVLTDLDTAEALAAYVAKR